MTREQARGYINRLLPAELKAAKKKGTYICPLCGNGSGKDGDGITSRDGGRRWKCFKCGFGGDYLDLLKRQYGTNDEQEIFERYIITIEEAAADHPPIVFIPGKSVSETGREQFNNFFLQANRALHESGEAIAYLRLRGISLETADHFMLGYCPEWVSPTSLRAGKRVPASRRIIIPTGESSYTARAIDPDVLRFRFMKEGEAEFFNYEVLYGTEPVFIVEGAFDALSVYEAGGCGCALGSASGVDKFLQFIGKEEVRAPLILSLDNDDAGREAQAKLRTALESSRRPFYELNLSGRYKDPNEHLTSNSALFEALVKGAPKMVMEAVERDTREGQREYLETAAAYYLKAFFGEIAAMRGKAIGTGFKQLDAALDGGLYEGLYIIGAISSLGKTTFALQVADQVAGNGADVLIFSMEMSRYELISKSISRLTFEHCGDRPYLAKTTRGILDGMRHKFYSQEECDLIERSAAIYGDYGRHIYIHEGMGTVGTERIKEVVSSHISLTGRAPVVIIDYLQILAPNEVGGTDKQNTDRAVLDLKQLSRDNRIPVLAISSFNRDNYTAPVNLASFKESGAIEYSSDILLGLQLTGMDELKQGEGRRVLNAKQIESWKAADPRKAQLKVLKNRNGKIGVSIYFDYYSMFNTFKEL